MWAVPASHRAHGASRRTTARRVRTVQATHRAEDITARHSRAHRTTPHRAAELEARRQLVAQHTQGGQGQHLAAAAASIAAGAAVAPPPATAAAADYEYWRMVYWLSSAAAAASTTASAAAAAAAAAAATAATPVIHHVDAAVVRASNTAVTSDGLAAGLRRLLCIA